MGNCKFCGADYFEETLDHGGDHVFACGSRHVLGNGDWAEDWLQSGRCHELAESKDTEELASYRAMFPIPPWSEEKITPEVCERLGMVRSRCESRTGDPVSWWRDPTGELSVRVAEDETWIAGFGYNKTAGKLACLVAARREQK